MDAICALSCITVLLENSKPGNESAGARGVPEGLRIVGLFQNLLTLGFTCWVVSVSTGSKRLHSATLLTMYCLASLQQHVPSNRAERWLLNLQSPRKCLPKACRTAQPCRVRTKTRCITLHANWCPKSTVKQCTPRTAMRVQRWMPPAPIAVEAHGGGLNGHRMDLP